MVDRIDLNGLHQGPQVVGLRDEQTTLGQELPDRRHHLVDVGDVSEHIGGCNDPWRADAGLYVAHGLHVEIGLGGFDPACVGVFRGSGRFDSVDRKAALGEGVEQGPVVRSDIDHQRLVV